MDKEKRYKSIIIDMVEYMGEELDPFDPEQANKYVWTCNMFGIDKEELIEIFDGYISEEDFEIEEDDDDTGEDF